MYAIGSTVRRVVRVYAADGVTLADADSTPASGTLRVNGSDTAAVVSVTKRAATTGTYDVSCSLAGRSLGDECLLTVEFVIGGVTVPWESDTFRVTLDSNNLVPSNLTRIGGETAPPLNLVSLLNDYIQNPGLDANVIRWKGTNVAVGGPDNRPLVRVDQLASNTVTAASIAAEALNGKGDWNVGKTGYSLSAAGVQAIWDALTSALTTAGSIGKRILDFFGVYTDARGGYLDKLNVAGTLAHTDNADTFKADVSGLSTLTTGDIPTAAQNATATAAAILETPENKLATDASGNVKVAFEEEDIDSIVDGVSAGLNIPTVDEIHSSLAGQPLYPVSRVTHGNIVVVRGDSYILADGTHLSLVEPANSGWPTDLTGWTLSFTADRHPSLSTGDASITATTAPTLSATTGTGRIIRVQLGTADTDGLATDSNGVLAYNFDVVATSSGKRVTLWRGAMSVLEERTAIA